MAASRFGAYLQQVQPQKGQPTPTGSRFSQALQAKNGTKRTVAAPAPKPEPRGVLDYLGEAKDSAVQGFKDVGGAIGSLFKNPLSEEQRGANFDDTAISAPSKFLRGTLGIIGAPIAPLINQTARTVGAANGKTEEQSMDALSKSFDAPSGFGKMYTDFADKTRSLLGKEPLSERRRSDSEGLFRTVFDVAPLLEGAVKAPKPKQAKPEKAPVPSKAVAKRVGVLEKLEGSNAPLSKYVEKNKGRGFDPKSDIAATDLLVDSVDNDGLLRTKTEGGAVSQYQEFLKPMESVVTDVLKRDGKSVSLDVVRKKMTQAVNESGMKGASKMEALSRIEREIEGLKLDADASGNIPLSEVHAAKVDRYANVNYMNEGGRLDKTLARALKEIVEENAASKVIEQLNKELARHYTNLGYLERLDRVRVKGGRLGKYFARTLGAMVGMKLGPLGALGGAKLADKIQGMGMERTFGKATGGGELTPSRTMTEALNPEPQKLLPAGDISKQTIQLPAKGILEGQEFLRKTSQSSNRPNLLATQSTTTTKTAVPKKASMKKVYKPILKKSS